MEVDCQDADGVETDYKSLDKFYLKGKGVYKVLVGLKGKHPKDNVPIEIHSHVKGLFGKDEYDLNDSQYTQVVCDHDLDNMTEEEIEEHLAYHADEKVTKALSSAYGVDFTPQVSEEEE